MKKKIFNFKPIWLVAPAIVVVWMLVMYYIGEVYPFGDATLIGYDLRHGSMPVIYYVYDAWHSGNFLDLFYNFTNVGGFSWNIILMLLQPRHLFALFWEREYLTQAVEVFFIVEFAFIALAASYSFSKLFPKLSAQWLALVSLMYTFSGFNLLYYTNIDWLDIVLLYPLLIVFAVNMMKGESKFPFFFVLTYMLIMNTYMSFFVMLSLVLFGGLYIFIIEEKENRKKAIFNLGVGAGASLLASSHSIISASGLLSSARFEEGAYVLDSATGAQEKLGGFSGILNAENEIDIVAVFMFLGMAIALASLVVLWFHFKKHKESRKYTVFFTTVIALFVVQIVFKSVMLIWHVGSYQKFPFRNGYMVAFFCCCIVAYYFSNFADLEGIKTKYNLVNVFSFVPAFFAAIPVLSYADVFIFSILKNFYVLNDLVEYQTGCLKYPYTCFALATIICFLLIKIIKYKKLRNLLTFTLAIIMIGINSFCLIAKQSYLEDGSLYEMEKTVYETVEEQDAFNRVNNTDGLMIANHPYVSGKPGISGWVHTLSENHLKSIKDLGFSSFFTYVYDLGGTAFSKSLLRVTDTVSQSELNNELYTKYDESENELKFYSNNYTLPFGLVFDENIKAVNAMDSENLFEFQNAIYNALSEDGDLFSKVQYTDIKEKTKKEDYYVSKEKEDGSGKELFKEKKNITTVTYTFDVDEKSVLYLHNSNPDEPIAFVQLNINGEKYHVFDGVSVIGSDEEFNTAYPNSINNGILELGVFENETVNVSIKYSLGSPTTEGTALYLMDLNKLNKLNEKFSGNNYTVEEGRITLNLKAEENDVILVPLSYDANWNCTVNGESVNPICIIGNFIGIEAQEGENKVVMEFSCRQSYYSLALIFACVLVGLAVLFAEKRIKFPNGLYSLLFVAFSVVFIAGMVVIYILPVGWSVATEFISLFK